VKNVFTRRKTEHLVSLPVAAIARGTVDTAFNAVIILFTGVLILVYMIAALLGIDLRHSAVDALLYKNWFWWGLDLVADGLVLIFVAGSWYLLATLITGKKLFMENIARQRCWSNWWSPGRSGRTTCCRIRHSPAILKVVSGRWSRPSS